ncbi:cation diffusion facilitator family transporter [Actinoplanes siamensis]|uniref:Cation efflux system protein n=1 Tax=Actinoplanes siamensis TaxID=1223317 RepID=A0A919TMF6_9ACTN|nr:cation diffusion facilitator family transporter [Actinoplanes siamensis]GIF08271.1 cation efflux system protein [Actinoplanes siamensis]
MPYLRWPHARDTAERVDAELESSRAGVRALWISLAVLGATAVAQAVIFWFAGSAALLGDTLHNAAGALTAVPLGIAFWLGRRAATRSYTQGFGRAGDLAGVAVVLVIAASAAVSAAFAVHRLAEPRTVTHLPWMLAAGVTGFAGNELVARYRIAVGRRIGSAALVADGLYARTDGFASLSVVLAAAGAALGWHWADPVVGLLLTLVVVLVVKDTGRNLCRRLMDRVDPELAGRAERELRLVPGVRDVCGLRLRWIGHHLHAEAAIVVDAALTLMAAHEIAADAEHQLTHHVPRLTGATVHATPDTHPGAEQHLRVSPARTTG